MYQSVNYQGKLSSKQLFAGKEVMEYEQDVFTPYQNLLYRQLLFGYEAFNKQELASMSPQELKTIKFQYAKAQRVLNVYKQTILTKRLSALLVPIFHNSNLVKEFCSDFTDKKFFCTVSFKDLNISKEDLVSLLITNRLLPNNFHAL
jgi:hypothetical protein